MRSHGVEARNTVFLHSARRMLSHSTYLGSRCSRAKAEFRKAFQSMSIKTRVAVNSGIASNLLNKQNQSLRFQATNVLGPDLYRQVARALDESGFDVAGESQKFSGADGVALPRGFIDVSRSLSQVTAQPRHGSTWRRKCKIYDQLKRIT